jgi:hypothetical protein
LISQVLTYTAGYLGIRYNTVLTIINLPSLSSVVGYLLIAGNPRLTRAQLPKLTFVGSVLLFCENHASFVIPSGPPDAPFGGLQVTGQYKDTDNCNLESGTAACGTLEKCP